MNKYIILFLTFLSCFVSCESLEETYADYDKGGEIRYLGRCSDVVVKAGWNRLIVNWTNSPDPIVDKIKITWSKDEKINETLLDKGTTEYCIPDLEDGNYEIKICAKDANGNCSLESVAYGRPYTENHEMVQSFTRIVSNHFFLKNHLVLFFQGWEENVESAYLTYSRLDGSDGRLELDRNLVNGLYYLLPDEIDPAKPVSLFRTGHIEDCGDKIVFEPMTLENIKLFNADFKQEMKRQFGFDGDIPIEWTEQVEEIYLDWTISSFADLLYMPNLKKIVLGKHRYIRDELVDDSDVAQNKVYETQMSDFVLKTLHELNQVEVERYNKHYSSLTPAPYIKEMGQSILSDDYDFMDLSHYIFTVTPEDKDDYKSYLEHLTDGRYDTDWEPASQAELTTYYLDLDLKQEVNMQGLKLVQLYSINANKRSWCPNVVRIYVSQDGELWENATYLEELEIGNSMGEINIIPFVNGGKNARYLRVVLTTPFANPIYHLALAEIGLY